MQVVSLPCRWTLLGQVKAAPGAKIKICVADQADHRGTTRFTHTQVLRTGQSTVERLLDGTEPCEVFVYGETEDGTFKSAVDQPVPLKKGDVKTVVIEVKLPKIDVAAELDFQKVVGGATKTMDLAIRNIGEVDLVLGAIAYPAGFAADDTNTVIAGATIAPNATVTMKVKFAPDSVGAKSGDLTIASNDPDQASKPVALKGEQAAPSLELFRAATVLRVVPFATTDVAAVLDGALPDVQQRVAAADRPGALDADFTFPPNTALTGTAYATNARGDVDASIFRLRLKDVPVAVVDDTIELTLKVTTGATPTAAIMGTGRYGGTASHAAGMRVTLRRNDRVWESPYLRVATTIDALSRADTSTIVHSVAPVPLNTVDPVQGKQFGRKLGASCTVGGAPVNGSFTMGGRPYARVPVQFNWIGPIEPAGRTRMQKRAADKIAELNQYWAGQGVEFVLKDGTALVVQLAPERKLIVIGEHTGRAVVADHDFTIAISLAVTIGATRHTPAAIPVNALANSDPPTVAEAIAAAMRGWRPDGALTGLQLDADVFDFPDPRVKLAYDIGDGNPAALPTLGARGPTDITLKRIAGPEARLDVVGIAVRNGVDIDTTVDIFSPPVDLPFHDPNVNPASAAQRAWVRAFGPPNGDYVSVLISAVVTERPLVALCAPATCSLFADAASDETKKARMLEPLRAATSSTSPISILNFGRWSERCARFVVFLGEQNTSTGGNDLQHELGHTLCDRNHTTPDPAWFYDCELMHPSGPAKGKANQMTRNKIRVDTVADRGGWKALWEDLASGYGGAARARISALAGGWLVADDGSPGFPW